MFTTKEIKELITQCENSSELLRLFQAAGVFHFDSVGVEKSSIKDINFTAIDKYFQRYQIDFSSESEEGQQPRPQGAGLEK
ncbi:hypothetical protein GMMP15_1030080 [Candidatus Magnetomoraceae bacterium gMMP-15]